eukprot:CAMPEP_0173422468 /NCGR_PEP_ID=MMETSP1357-20121228/3164_1 /TAXON_ID=77926 /ORGANISM="Hemiselmis rufescens, Strain PCC563" /LENGTH=340 /DNA_ID=CAMNT_0014385497 /DNA_START=31 /DNA_END=1053 /DNA_ORIENTATION=+
MQAWVLVLCLLGLVYLEHVGCFMATAQVHCLRVSTGGSKSSMLRPLPGSRCPTRPLRARTHRGVAVLSAQSGTSRSDQNGVQLPDSNVKEVSVWLSDEIRQWLDDEWIPRDIHRDIGEIAAGAYEAAREKGVNEAGDILMEVANKMMEVNLYEADVGAFDIANKVTDLLLINDGRDVCCTAQPYSAGPGSSSVAVEDDALAVPPEAVAWTMPGSSFDRYQFLQQAIDGRAEPSVVDRAVLESLGYTVRKEAGTSVYDPSGVTDDRALGISSFVGNAQSCEVLQEMLEENLEEQNKEEEDLVPLVEALVGEAAFKMAKEEGDADFAMREVCVKWLHFKGGY